MHIQLRLINPQLWEREMKKMRQEMNPEVLPTVGV